MMIFTNRTTNYFDDNNILFDEDRVSVASVGKFLYPTLDSNRNFSENISVTFKKSIGAFSEQDQ